MLAPTKQSSEPVERMIDAAHGLGGADPVTERRATG